MAANETELERLVVRLVGDADSYLKMLKDAEAASKKTVSAVEKVGRRIEAVGKQLKAVGRSMSLRVTAPLLAVGGAATKAFADFDKAMVESTSIMRGVTVDQKSAMRELALDLARSGEAGAQGPKSIAESYFFLASAGKNVQQSMALLPQVMKFATAGAFDMATATDLLTDAQSALGKSFKDPLRDAREMAMLSDTLVGANTLANASVQQFATALTTKAGAAMKSFNIATNEGVAVLAAMADQGIKAELAGNAYDRILRLLAKSSRDNAAAHEKFGFKVFDATGKMRKMWEIIGDLERITKDMSDETKSATLEMLGFEARVQGVVLPIIGTSDAMKEYNEGMGDLKGITDEVARSQLKSFSAQMKILWNRITVVAIKIGEVLAPWVEKIGKMVASATESFTGLDKSSRKWVVGIGVVAAAVGPALIAIGSLTTWVGRLTLAYNTLTTSTSTAAAAQKGFAMATTVAKVAIVGFAVYGVAALANELRDNLTPAFQKTKKEAEEFTKIVGKEATREAEKSARIVMDITGGDVDLGDQERRLVDELNRLQKLAVKTQIQADEKVRAARDKFKGKLPRGQARVDFQAAVVQAEALDEKAQQYRDSMKEAAKALEQVQEQIKIKPVEEALVEENEFEGARKLIDKFTNNVGWKFGNMFHDIEMGSRSAFSALGSFVSDAASAASGFKIDIPIRYVFASNEAVREGSNELRSMQQQLHFEQQRERFKNAGIGLTVEEKEKRDSDRKVQGLLERLVELGEDAASGSTLFEGITGAINLGIG